MQSWDSISDLACLRRFSQIPKDEFAELFSSYIYSTGYTVLNVSLVKSA